MMMFDDVGWWLCWWFKWWWIIIGDEFLHANDNDICDERMHAKCWGWWWWWLNERMHYWVICLCIHKCWVGYLYPYWRWLEYFVFILTMIMILLYPIGDDRYHMHIESCLEHIAYIESVMFDYVLGDYVHRWNLVTYVLDEVLWKCEDVRRSCCNITLAWLMYEYTMWLLWINFN